MTSPVDIAFGDPSAHRDHLSDVFPIEGSSRAPKMPRRKRRTTHVTRQQAKNLIEALEFAEVIGRRLNVSIDICWTMFSGFTDDRLRIARCQERLSKWSARRGIPLTMLWVREMGKYESPHVHILLHVPPWLMENEEGFRLVLERTLEPEGGLTHERAILIQPADSPIGKLNYMLKGMRKVDATLVGVLKTSSEGQIVGKRVGFTENIGPAARKRFYLASRKQSTSRKHYYLASKKQSTSRKYYLASHYLSSTYLASGKRSSRKRQDCISEANRATAIAATPNTTQLRQKTLPTGVPSEIVASKFEGDGQNRSAGQAMVGPA